MIASYWLLDGLIGGPSTVCIDSIGVQRGFSSYCRDSSRVNSVIPKVPCDSYCIEDFSSSRYSMMLNQTSRRAINQDPNLSARVKYGLRTVDPCFGVSTTWRQ